MDAGAFGTARTAGSRRQSASEPVAVRHAFNDQCCWRHLDGFLFAGIEKSSSFCLAAALLRSTLRRLLSILLLRHLESFLFAGIDFAFPDAQPSLEAV